MEHLKTKYVMFGDEKWATPIIFPNGVIHRDLASLIQSELGRPISAGFCFLSAGAGWKCFGESISLNLKSRGEVDAKIMNDLLSGGIYSSRAKS
jgi:hypothetical protein